ncbi:hypothetical protein ABIF66_008844 [Bradyrhizobium japonicum]|uniref:hypothetical protein n=1 Tax=Bradyrhizobium liaoningense TaxID=43992 RepID=UPI001BAD31CF|nr:hypothetical protein [Bradyrhizobium liaoningense]MBR1070240.1 hypothetical protein [Bradyrhizobium liaoningense]
MGMFNTKKPPAEPANNGTEQLRRLLISRNRRRAMQAIATDINDVAAEKAGRELARNIASNMAGAGASPDVVTSLAKSTFANLSAPNIKVITETALQSFADGGDLSVDGKLRLTAYLCGDHKTYSAERDAIVLADIEEPPTYTHPARWENPNPAIRAAQAELRRVQAQAREAR